MKNINTIKKIRFVSFVTTLLTYFIINTNNIYAMSSKETYINASTSIRLISMFILFSALFSAIAFIYTSIYILIKE